MNTEAAGRVGRDEAKGFWLLWGGVLAGPIAWLVQFQIRYSLVPWVCTRHKPFVLHTVAGVFLLLVVVAGIFCWRTWVMAGKQWPTETESGPKARNVFLSLLGMLTSSLFALLIIAQGIPAFILDPCQD